MNITRELLRQWRACYSNYRIDSLVPEGGLTPVEVCDMADVPVTDRIWVLLRPDVLGDAFQQVLDTIVERALRRLLGSSGIPEWETWAQNWLDGDRSEDAAKYAARCVVNGKNYSTAAAAAESAQSAAMAVALAACAANYDHAARDARVTARCAADYAYAYGSSDWCACLTKERERQLADIRAVLIQLEPGGVLTSGADTLKDEVD